MELESTRGSKQDLPGLRGRAVVLFYASYRHSGDNDAHKRACGRLVELHPDRLTVLGVASLRGLDRPLMGAWVRRAVRRIAEHYGVELWMDFDGILQQPPLALDAESSVAVLAPDGEVLFRENGPIRHADAFYSAVEEALERAARACPPPRGRTDLP